MRKGHWKRVESNIYFCGDFDRSKPYLWKQTIDGVPYREFFRELVAARAAKKAKLASVAKYSSLAHEFDKRAYLEYRTAKNLLVNGQSLIDVVKFWNEHNAGIADSSTTIEEAYKLFLNSKSKARLKRKKKPLSKEHLSDLTYRGRLLVARFGHLPPARISGRHLLALYDDSSKAGRSILNDHATLRNFFGWCVRSGLLVKNPYDEIREEDLPDAGISEKHPLSLDSVVRMFVYFEEHWPVYCPWLALRLFVGIRTKEAQRFDPQWINCERRMIRVPGWTLNSEDQPVPGAKTRDDWALYDVPSNFWAWIDEYPPTAPKGHLPYPYHKVWRKIRDGMIEEGIIDRWESNALRDTFCTFHYSAELDPKKTAAMMKQRNVDTMFQNYLGCLRPMWEGRAYRGIYPGLSRVSTLRSTFDGKLLVRFARGARSRTQ